MSAIAAEIAKRVTEAADALCHDLEISFDDAKQEAEFFVLDDYTVEEQELYYQHEGNQQ